MEPRNSIFTPMQASTEIDRIIKRELLDAKDQEMLERIRSFLHGLEYMRQYSEL